MSYLTKDDYLRREASAARRAMNNEAIGQANGLSEEQTDALDELCAFRHKMHTSAAEELAYGEERAWTDELSCEGCINSIILDYLHSKIPLNFSALFPLSATMQMQRAADHQKTQTNPKNPVGYLETQTNPKNPNMNMKMNMKVKVILFLSTLNRQNKNANKMQNAANCMEIS